MADTTATLARTAAPIPSLAGRRAAPIQSPADTNDRSLVVLRVQAENALNAALTLLRNPRLTDSDLHRATGRACRAATLLKRLSAAQAQGGAA